MFILTLISIRLNINVKLLKQYHLLKDSLHTTGHEIMIK